MELRYKPDFEAVVERFEAWWRCEIIDRPPVTLAVEPTAAPKLPAKEHPTIRDCWMDVEYSVECFEASLETAVLVGETVPLYWPNLGPEVTATLFGCELDFSGTTSWSRPIAASCREIAHLQPDLRTVYWDVLHRMTDLSLARGEGRWITGLTDLHTNADLLAALRDPQELCLELAEDIEAVRAACDHVTDYFPLIYEDMYGPIAAAGHPAATWAPVLHRGRMYPVSCDLICMISPEMFARAVLPSLQREMQYLDRCIFHLDGPDALRHLDVLLAQEDLDALQWVYGAGNGPAARWIDVYRKAQEAGKCIQLLCEDLDDAMTVAENLHPEGLWFCPGGRYARDEAEAFIKHVERWAAGKR